MRNLIINAMNYLIRPYDVEPSPLDATHREGVCRPLTDRAGLPMERLAIGLHTYEPGGSAAEQCHDDREFALYLLEGVMSARVGGETFTAQRGDLVFVPRATRCYFKNDNEQALSFLRIAAALDSTAPGQASRHGVYHLRPSDIEPVLVGGSHKNMTSRQCIRPQRVDAERLVLDISTYWSGGGNNPLAHSDAEQVYYVMEGKMRAYVADQQYDAGPGDIIFIPRNTLHWHENAGQDHMTYMLIGVTLV